MTSTGFERQNLLETDTACEPGATKQDWALVSGAPIAPASSPSTKTRIRRLPRRSSFTHRISIRALLSERPCTASLAPSLAWIRLTSPRPTGHSPFHLAILDSYFPRLVRDPPPPAPTAARPRADTSPSVELRKPRTWQKMPAFAGPYQETPSLPLIAFSKTHVRDPN